MSLQPVQTLFDFAGGTNGATPAGSTVTGGSATYDNTNHAGTSTLCGRYVITAGSTSNQANTRSGSITSATAKAAFSIAVTPKAFPASSLKPFASFRGTSGGVVEIEFNSTGKLQVINFNAGTTLYTGLVTLSVNSDYSFEVLVDNTTSGSSTFQINTYNSAGICIDSSPKITGLTYGQPATNFTTVDVGVLSNGTTVALDIQILNLRVQVDADTWIGPIWGTASPTTIVATVPPPNTNGTVATIANTGFDGVNVDTNHFTIDSVGGLQGLDFNQLTNQIYGEWFTSFGTQSDIYWAMDLYYAATNTSSSKQFVRGLTSAVQNWAISFSSQTLSTTPARLVIRDAANTVILTSPATVAGEVPQSVWCRLEGHVVSAGAATTVEIRLFTGAGDAIPQYSSGPITLAANTGSSNDHFRVGQIDTSGMNVFMRNVRVGTGQWFGPAAIPGSEAIASVSTIGVTGNTGNVATPAIASVSTIGVVPASASSASPAINSVSAIGIVPVRPGLIGVTTSDLTVGSGTFINMPLPAGSKAGDIAYVSVGNSTSTPVTYTNPSGWSTVMNGIAYTNAAITASMGVLTSTDITNGYIALTSISNVNHPIFLNVWNGDLYTLDSSVSLPLSSSFYGIRSGSLTTVTAPACTPAHQADVILLAYERTIATGTTGTWATGSVDSDIELNAASISQLLGTLTNQPASTSTGSDTATFSGASTNAIAFMLPMQLLSPATTGTLGVVSTSTIGVTGSTKQTGTVAVASVSAIGVSGQSGTTSTEAINSVSSIGVAGSTQQSGSVAIASVSTIGVTRLTPIQRWLALPPGNRIIAHRGAENDFPEMTRSAYLSCTKLGMTAFNIDVVWTSDGVPVASHDATSNRVFSQTGVTFASVTWASISGYTTINGGLPIERADDLGDYIVSICPDASIWWENKIGGSVAAAFNAMLAARNDPLGRNVYKSSYGGTTGLASAKAANAVGWGWGYWFPADTAAITAPNALPWDSLGLEWDATSGDWTTLQGIAAAQGGKLIFGHVIDTLAHANAAWALGAQGLMAGKVLTIFPGATEAINSVSTIGITGNVKETATAAIASVSSIGISATVSRTAAPAINSVSSIGIAGTETQSGIAAIASVSAIGIATLIVRPATVAIASVSTVGVGTLIVRPAVEAIASVSSIGESPLLVNVSTIPIASVSTIGVQSSSSSQSAVPIASSSIITVAGLDSQAATVPIASTSSISVTGNVNESAVEAINSVSLIGISGAAGTTSGLAIISVSSVGVTGNTAQSTTEAITSTSVINVTGNITVTASVAVSSVSTIAVTGATGTVAGVAIVSTSVINVTGTEFQIGLVHAVSVSTISVTGLQTIPHAAAISSVSMIGVTSATQNIGVVAIRSVSVITVTGIDPQRDITVTFTSLGRRFLFTQSSPRFTFTSLGARYDLSSQ